MSYTVLNTVEGRHELAIAEVYSDRSSGYGTLIANVRGIVIGSTVAGFVKQRWIWSVDINRPNEMLIKNFLQAAYGGGGFAAFCMDFDGWCKSDRRALVQASVTSAVVKWAKSGATLEAVGLAPAQVVTAADEIASRMASVSEEERPASRAQVANTYDYARDLDLGDDE